MEVGHTKFKPDKLFASIAKTFYDRDVFCIEMLQAICELYSVTHTLAPVTSFSGGPVLRINILQFLVSPCYVISLSQKNPFNIGINVTWDHIHQ